MAGSFLANHFYLFFRASEAALEVRPTWRLTGFSRAELTFPAVDACWLFTWLEDDELPEPCIPLPLFAPLLIDIVSS